MKKDTIFTIICVAIIIVAIWTPAKSAIVWFDSQDFLHRILMLTTVGVVTGLTYRYSGHSTVVIGD